MAYANVLSQYNGMDQPPNMGAYAPSNNFDQLNNAQSTISFNPDKTSPASPYQPGGTTQPGGINPSGGAQQTPISAGNGTLLGSIAYGNYQQTPGWDTGKLNDPNKHDPKYDWLRARQSTGPGGDLSAAVNYYNQHLSNGESPATWQGGDKVDFGQGVGPVDVLYGSKAGINSDLWAPINSDSNFSGNDQPGSNNGMFDPSSPIMRQIMDWFMGGQGGKFNTQPYYGKLWNTIPDQGWNPIAPYGQPQSFNQPIMPPMFANQPQSNPTSFNQPPSQGFAYWPGMQMQPGVNY